jgi:hypothetical protein
VITCPAAIPRAAEPTRYAHMNKSRSMGTRPSVLQSGSGRYLTEGVGFSPEAFCDGFVPHWVPARSLQFNPQALDACQTMAVFFDNRTVGQGGSMRQNVPIKLPSLLLHSRAV